ncbi:MAG TPA: type II secretion system F family protein [Gemmatimonadales bacterium]|nr:type II secretion system F family protein [Gemmatimonadales bacterium]
MLIVALVLIALCVGAAVLFVMELAPSRSSAVARRLEEVKAGGTLAPPDVIRRRRRQEQAERLTAIIQALGEKVEVGHRDTSALRLRLIQAGYPQASAVPIYLGARIGLPLAMGGSLVLLLPALGQSWVASVLMGVWGALFGYIAPTFIIRSRIARRQKQMQKALPDALDLLVVCVEAGLGLNQAMVRVAEEIERVSPVLSEQIGLVNLEIRAGTPRDEAFRNLGHRTGVQDIKSLMAMLIQTDRFGTSIAQALRTHAETMRTKRRQRAEEAAAKTTIKLVFPLVLFIFPALFVIILGPALIQIFEALGSFPGG